MSGRGLQVRGEAEDVAMSGRGLQVRGRGGGRGNVWQGTAGTWEGKEGSVENEDMGGVRMSVLRCIRIITPECVSLCWSALLRCSDVSLPLPFSLVCRPNGSGAGGGRADGGSHTAGKGEGGGRVCRWERAPGDAHRQMDPTPSSRPKMHRFSPTPHVHFICSSPIPPSCWRGVRRTADCCTPSRTLFISMPPNPILTLPSGWRGGRRTADARRAHDADSSHGWWQRRLIRGTGGRRFRPGGLPRVFGHGGAIE